MKTTTKLFIMLLVVAIHSIGYSQHKIFPMFNYGAYLHNSENETNIMEGKTIRSILGGSIGYNYSYTKNYDLQIEFAYSTSSVDIFQIVFQSPYEGSLDGNLKLKEYTFDGTVLLQLYEWLNVGAGPSFVIINRIITIDNNALDDNNRSITIDNNILYDRLSSSGIGINILLQLQIPFTSDSPFFIISNLKFRYTHSVGFDKKGRNLDNYSQSYFRGIGSIGIGLKF